MQAGNNNRRQRILHICILYLSSVLIFFSHFIAAEDAAKRRVIVSTDIGGTDPDDFQSMVHLLLYADVLQLEGLISSPYGPGRKQDILRVIDKYEVDFKNLSAHSKHYASPDQLRKISKQGETQRAPYQGFRQATEGSNWIIERARVKDPRPLYILVWGGIEDLAQALHDAPDILPKLRVYWIGGPNKKWSPDAYQYIADKHAKLWIIESNASYRGWFVGGEQGGNWGNKSFVQTQIKGRGALGEFFMTQLGGTIKMGDSPSVAWTLHKNPEAADQAGWGGQYTRAWTRPYKKFHRLTHASDHIEEFSILELSLATELGADKALSEDTALSADKALSPDKALSADTALSAEKASFATMHIGNQSLKGHFIGNRVHFRFSPKSTGKFNYQLESSDQRLNGKTGSVTAVATKAGQKADPRWPNWWVDNPAPEYKEGPHIGAKSVNRWRKEFLEDFSMRIKRVEPKK